MESKINPHELTLTISLRKEDQKRMQLVYASQLYGTFFGVFGSFEINFDNPKDLKITAVNLRLINYKGLVNLGITGVSNKLVREKDDDGNEELRIYFKVQALCKPDVLRYYKFEKEESIGDGERLVFLRKLVPMTVDATTGLNSSGIYDGEFYERDGLYNRKRSVPLDDEPESDWGYDQHTGRRHKPRSNPNQLEINEFRNLNYIEGEIVDDFEFLNSKGKKFNPNALGGRCPKALSIAKY